MESYCNKTYYFWSCKTYLPTKTKEIVNFQSRWIYLTNQEEFIVQEFQKNVVENGEIALMLFGGEYSHVLKKAKKGDFRVQDDFGGTVQKITPSKI